MERRSFLSILTCTALGFGLFGLRPLGAGELKEVELEVRGMT